MNILRFIHILKTVCEDCKTWDLQNKKTQAARVKYREHVDKISENDEVSNSLDLQKVIMLPRSEMFKSVIICVRLIVYNETFVSLDVKKRLQPISVLWHEAIRGKKKADIISTFYKFLLIERDAKKIIL